VKLQRGSTQSIFKRLACAQLVCVQLALPAVFAQGTAELESVLSGYEKKLEERKLTEQDVAAMPKRTWCWAWPWTLSD
jgi:hypothetical protein